MGQQAYNNNNMYRYDTYKYALLNIPTGICEDIDIFTYG